MLRDPNDEAIFSTIFTSEKRGKPRSEITVGEVKEKKTFLTLNNAYCEF